MGTIDEPLTDPQFLYLTTTGWKTGKQHRIEIWYVKNNRKYYVMSELGKAAHWVRNISHDPKISFRINRLTFNGHARKISRTLEGISVSCTGLKLDESKIRLGPRPDCGTRTIKFRRKSYSFIKH